MGKEKQQL